MEKNIDTELAQITREMEEIKKAKLKVADQLNDFELLFKQNDSIFNELSDVWKEGEMNKLIFDVKSDIQKNQSQLLRELYYEEDELDRKRKILENTYSNLSWEKEKSGRG